MNVEEAMAQAGRSAIVLRHQSSVDKKHPLSTCLGGAASLPVGFDWPVHRRTAMPLIFIGQVNFADIPVALSSTFGLPTQGLIQLFYRHPDSLLTEGVEGESQDDHIVAWHPDVENTQWSAVEDGQTISPTQFPLQPQSGLSVMSHADLEATHLLNEAEIAAFYAQQRPAHQLCGLPKFVQYDPFEAVPAESRSWFISWRNRLPAQHVVKDTWQLLWQIDSDPQVGLNWVDGGIVYLLIRSKDLQEGNLSNLYFNLQTF